MAMEEIVISTALQIKLENFVATLLEEGYFGFGETANEYVLRIYDFIYAIPALAPRKCVKAKYGKYFVRYDNRISKMQYFNTFDKKDDCYFIQNIISPKTKEYQNIIGN
jgi:hypothetical protein